MSGLAQREREKRETSSAVAKARSRERDQKALVAALNEGLAADYAAKERIEEDMAKAIAEDLEYEGPPIPNIPARHAEIDHEERVRAKMHDVTLAKSRADNDATNALYAAQRRACAQELRRRGYPKGDRFSPDAIGHFTVREWIECEHLRAFVDQRPASLPAMVFPVIAPDWTTIDACERAFATARGETGDGG